MKIGGEPIFSYHLQQYLAKTSQHQNILIKLEEKPFESIYFPHGK